ncbi:MAG: hypothetical protein ACLP50_33285 [Solirubrobacteraceae bacterium]
MLEHVSGAGDAATVLIAGPLGWVGDVLLIAHSPIGPAVMGVCCASCALGLKKAFESVLERPSVRKRRGRAAIGARARNLLDAMEHPDRFAAVAQANDGSHLVAPFNLAVELKLWSEGVLSDEELNATIDRATVSLQTWLHELEQRPDVRPAPAVDTDARQAAAADIDALVRHAGARRIG